jgi:Protein of unknown function (DUF2628)
MATYTVHAPPPRRGESAAPPERFKFVRDGFYFWAFLLAPFWLLVHRLWLALFGYLVLSGAIGVGLYMLHISQSVSWLVGLLIMLLVGFEASTLWRWKLSRRGWTLVGFAVGENLEIAERRFFAAWATRKPGTTLVPAAPRSFSAPPARGAAPPSEIIGLFPEAGEPR